MAKFTPAWTLVVCLASGSVLYAQDTMKPLGKWERKIGKNHVALIVEDNRLHIRFTGGEVSGSAHADYTMTRDGVLFGIVTSLECDDEDKEAEGIKEFLNAPFSFRFRIDEGALVISDVKTVFSGSKDDDMLNGRFKATASSAARAAVVPTAYTIPTTNAPSVPPQPTPIGASFTTPAGMQFFNYSMGFSR